MDIDPRLHVCSIFETFSLAKAGEAGAIVSVLPHREIRQFQPELLAIIEEMRIPHYVSYVFSPEDKHSSFLMYNNAEKLQTVQAEARLMIDTCMDMFNALGTDKKMVIHCAAGLSRSPSALFAFINTLYKDTLPIEAPFKYIYQQSPKTFLDYFSEAFADVLGSRYYPIKAEVQNFAQIQKGLMEIFHTFKTNEQATDLDIEKVSQSRRRSARALIAKHNEAAQRFGIRTFTINGL